MKVVIINKSDSTGGAAVVSRRLMEALRENNVDAHMLICEKLTDSPYVKLASGPKTIKRKFLLERIKIFMANGFNRKNLFKIDTGEIGLPLWKHPLVKEADAILLNWINQGMLSLKGIKKILRLGKPVIFTMHDMWCMTGICHHAGMCRNYLEVCGDCPLLTWKSSPHDLSYKIWRYKNKIYSHKTLTKKAAFVAVSNWLKQKSMQSSLLQKQRVEVIPNAFKISESGLRIREENGKVRILFGAARIDDPIKGLPTLKRALDIMTEEYPDIAGRMEVAVFGSTKDPGSLDNFSLPLINLGILHGEDNVAKAYQDSDIVVSASSYETLPGTIVEAQAYGCVPVCFKRGGQADIIDQLSTGYMAEYDSDLEIRARNLLQGIIWAFTIVTNWEKHWNMMTRMKENVMQKFSYQEIASKYINLISELSRN